MNETAPRAPGGANITLNWFHPEELSLIQRCLETAASGAYISKSNTEIVSGYTVEAFGELAHRFGAMGAIGESDFDRAYQAVTLFYNGPLQSPFDLGARLGVGQLHLGWFLHKMGRIKDKWASYAEQSGSCDDQAQHEGAREWLF